MHKQQNKEYKILVIEDNPADAALINIYLDDVGLKYKLLLAERLEEGIQQVFNNDVDLVLLDLSLPDSERYGTLKKFLGEVQNVPVIVMTGLNNEIMGIQAVRAGAQDFLVKGDFEGKRLARSIKYSLQRFNRQNKLRKTAKELSDHQKKYLAVLEMAKFGNWEMDIVNYSMNWTDEMFRIFGLKPQSFPTTLKDYLNLVHLEDRAKVEDFFEMAIKDGEVHRIKHRILINNRILKHIALQARVNYEELNLIGSIQDITEHWIQENKPEEEEEIPQLSLQEQVIKGISRNQMNHLQIMVEQLLGLRQENLNSSSFEHFDRISLQIGELFNSINKLFNISNLFSNEMNRLEETEFSIKSLFNKINQLVELLQYQNGNNLRLQLESNLPERIIGDFDKIQHIFLNLLCLAQKPGAKFVHFDYYVSSREIEENIFIIHIIVNCKGKTPKIENTEPLIESDNIMDLILEDNEDQWAGTLAIIGKLTKGLKGISQFRDKGDNGCHIELEFPVKIIRQENFESINQLETSLNILLVEDHPMNRHNTRRMLTSWSDMIKVDTAPNGEEGVSKFKELKYDIVLMDLQMPVMDGIEATRHIRAINNTPIIALTPNASREEEDHCYAVGMNEYLLKPIKSEDLYAKILKLVKRN